MRVPVVLNGERWSLVHATSPGRGGEGRGPSRRSDWKARGYCEKALLVCYFNLGPATLEIEWLGRRERGVPLPGPERVNKQTKSLNPPIHARKTRSERSHNCFYYPYTWLQNVGQSEHGATRRVGLCLYLPFPRVAKREGGLGKGEHSVQRQSTTHGTHGARVGGEALGAARRPGDGCRNRAQRDQSQVETRRLRVGCFGRGDTRCRPGRAVAERTSGRQCSPVPSSPSCEGASHRGDTHKQSRVTPSEETPEITEKSSRAVVAQKRPSTLPLLRRVRYLSFPLLPPLPPMCTLLRWFISFLSSSKKKATDYSVAASPANTSGET